MPSHTTSQAAISKAVAEVFNFSANKVAQKVREMMARDQNEVDGLIREMVIQVTNAIQPHVQQWGPAILDAQRLSSERRKQIDPILNKLPNFPGRQKAVSVVKEALLKSGAYKASSLPVNTGTVYFADGPLFGKTQGYPNFPANIVLSDPANTGSPITYSVKTGCYWVNPDNAQMYPVMMVNPDPQVSGVTMPGTATVKAGNLTSIIYDKDQDSLGLREAINRELRGRYQQSVARKRFFEYKRSDLPELYGVWGPPEEGDLAP